MIGNQKVIEAALDYQRQAWLLEEFARGRLRDPDQFKKATYDRRKARQRFYSEARADLGVASGEITTPSRT